jgi:hypothetical protein
MPPAGRSENCRLPICSVFEACGFRRCTFEDRMQFRSQNHFGQVVLVLYEICPTSVHTYSCIPASIALTSIGN